MNTLIDTGKRSPLFTVPPSQLLRLLWMTTVGSRLVSSHSLLDQKEGSCVCSPQLVPWEGRRERPSYCKSHQRPSAPQKVLKSTLLLSPMAHSHYQRATNSVAWWCMSTTMIDVSAALLYSASLTGMVGRTMSRMGCPLPWLLTH